MDYSLWAFLSLVLTVGPALGLGLYNGFVDSYPVWLCLGLGALVSILAASSRRGRPGDDCQKIIESAAQRSRALKQEKKERRLAATRPKPRKKNGAQRDESVAAKPNAGQAEDLPLVAVDPASAGRRLFRQMLLYAGPPCWVLVLGVLGNQWLDTSKPRTHRVPLREWQRTNKNPAGFAITGSWRTPHGEERIRVLSLTMDVDVPPGSPLLVTTREGFFGWEWVTSIRKEK
jgi:hypothetical protein